MNLSDNTNEFDIDTFWKKVLGIVQTEITSMVYTMWFTKITPLSLSEETLNLAVEMNYTKQQLKKYESLIKDAVEKVGKKKYKIEIKVEPNIKKERIPEKEENLPLFKTPKVDPKKAMNSGLFTKFNFENFVMGNSNQLAYAIAQAIAENPGDTYNPFFLYSDVGLGKTHLVQAIGNKIILDKPNLNVIYTTGESFMNELIETIQIGKGRGKYESNSFRNKYRKADVLIIDDIQFIVGRETTQMEVFHTFNALYMSGKQIILTSDRPPREFNTLEKRLTSRFGSGIIADIQRPDIDLKIAILRTKRDQSKDKISNDVIDFIAKNVDSNIREMEGAYLQILTQAKATNQIADVETAQKILGKDSHIQLSKKLSPNQVLKAVTKYYEVSLKEIKSSKRNKEIVIPRQVAMYLLREFTEHSLESIGDYLGGRDHTTIMHGCKKIEEEIKNMGKIRQDIIKVRELF